MAGELLASASSLWVQDSTSARRPSCSTMAPSSLHHSVSPLALPGSLVPSGSVRLFLPFSSSSVLCCSSSTVAFQIPASASVTWAICSTLAVRILLVTLAHRLSVSTSCSSTTSSATIGRPPGDVSPSSYMAPSSIGSTVGCHHGCGLGPTWHRMLQVPPVPSHPSLPLLFVSGIWTCFVVFSPMCSTWPSFTSRWFVIWFTYVL